MNTPAKNSVIDFLAKTPIDITSQPNTQRTTSPVNNSHYIKSNFMSNMINKANEQKNYQSFDNLYKPETSFYRPQHVITPVFAENRGFIPRTSANDSNNMMDFFQSSKTGAFSERINFSSPANHQNSFEERMLGMRKGSSSDAYLNAIKALQEKVGSLTDKVKHLESENGFLKTVQEEQRVERGREERQFQDSTWNILEKLESLGNENLALKQENKELMDNNQGLGKENAKLTEEKKKLKKRVVTMKAEAKTQQDMIGEFEKKLHKAQISVEEHGQRAKSVEEQLQEEVRSLKKEKEALEFKVVNLTEVVKKQENDLSQGKKMYNQHLEKLALANEALVHDNQLIKDHYSQEINEIGAELEMIQQVNAQKSSEYEEEIAELRKDNSKLAELVKMKNEEIQMLKAKNKEEEMKSELRESLNTVRARLSALRTTQSPMKTDITESESPKVSTSILTSFIREKTSYGSKDQTPEDLYRQAKMMLATQGDEARRVKGSLSSNGSSPERMTTRSNISRNLRYNKTEEDNVKAPTENRAHWKEKETALSSFDDNSGFMSNNEFRSRAERKEAKYHAHAVRTSYRDYSPPEDQLNYETQNPRSTLQGNLSGEKKGNMKSNYGTFGAEDKGIHQIFYSSGEGQGQREVLESWRDEDQTSQKPKTQKSFFNVIQGNR